MDPIPSGSHFDSTNLMTKKSYEDAVDIVGSHSGMDDDGVGIRVHHIPNAAAAAVPAGRTC